MIARTWREMGLLLFEFSADKPGSYGAKFEKAFLGKLPGGQSRTRKHLRQEDLAPIVSASVQAGIFLPWANAGGSTGGHA